MRSLAQGQPALLSIRAIANESSMDRRGSSAIEQNNAKFKPCQRLRASDYIIHSLFCANILR